MDLVAAASGESAGTKCSKEKLEENGHWQPTRGSLGAAPAGNQRPEAGEVACPRSLAQCADAEAGQSVEDEVADTLQVAALVNRFRQEGHLLAQLDPLGRVPHGPWMTDSPGWTPESWCGSYLTARLE